MLLPAMNNEEKSDEKNIFSDAVATGFLATAGNWR
jgi:hypothetical protein